MNQPMVVQGRVIRIDPSNASRETLPSLQGLPEKNCASKLNEIRKGADLRSQYEPFPDNRPCQDVCWVLLFLMTTAVVFGSGFMASPKLIKTLEHHKDTREGDIEFPPLMKLAAAVGAGACGSIVSAFAYIMLARAAPACVVWTSLVFSPVLMMVVGAGMIFFGLTSEAAVVLLLGGFILFALGMCQLSCVLCCWAKYVPFMIKLTEAVAEVIQRHPCMLFVGVIGACMGFFWTISCQMAFSAIYIQYEDQMRQMQEASQYSKYGVIFVTSLIFFWGSMIANNICHVTYAGVFGRWYYSNKTGGDQGALMPSFTVAVTTSLGSICFGSFLVAAVRALEQAARAARQDAQEEGIGVMCVMLCILEMIIGCIGDIMEYFNEWAYIQCAIRGVSFLEAAKITYSMMTCANVQYILSDLLLNSLVTFGSILCGIAGGASGAAAGFVLDGTVCAVWGGILGFLVGIMAGCASLSIISSGVKTILACWADDPAPLAEHNPELAKEFQQRIEAAMYN